MIDISSLDNYTKNRIEKLSKRCIELYQGSEIIVNLPVKIKWDWTEGDKCNVYGWQGEHRDVDWELIKKHEEELRQKIDEEIKDIIDFSNSVADRLGADQDEFFFKFFAA